MCLDLLLQVALEEAAMAWSEMELGILEGVEVDRPFNW
jgi:hypothetical protein